MKRVVAAVVLMLAAQGCKMPPRPAAPRPIPCRVNLAKLIAGHPRWPEVAALDARVGQLRARLGEPISPPREAALPQGLPSIPDPPAVAARPESPALRDFAKLSDSRTARLGEELKQRDERMLANYREGLQGAVTVESRAAEAERNQGMIAQEESVIRRYQAQETRLRLVIARLKDPSPIPEEAKRQRRELAARQEELRALHERQEAELSKGHDRLRQELAEAEQRDRAAADEDVRRLASEREETRQNILNTRRQDWQDRIDAAREALAEAPPGPVAPPQGSALAPIARPGVRIAPAAGPDPASPEKVLAGLQTRRARLAQVLAWETRARVEGIARRANLAPRFGAASRGVPDRTEFFARQLALAEGK